MIFNVAIVEDERIQAKKLESFLAQYGREKGVEFSIDWFSNGVDFVSDYVGKHDVVFMDIDMPLMNGMDCAVKLRTIDENVALVFVTNLVQYSVKGYEVDAMGYIVKPIEYYSFSVLMNRFLSRKQKSEDADVVIKTSDNYTRILNRDIYYVEVMDHYLIYHTTNGDHKVLGRMKDVDEKLKSHNFFRCSNSYLINMQYVKGVSGNEVVVGKDSLPISRQRKKEFLLAINEYFKRGGGK